MLRRLFALLAVISGFTLASVPVSAETARAVSIAQEAPSELCRSAVPTTLQIDPAGTNDPAIEAEPCAPLAAISTPTVLIGVDRSRE